MLMGPEECLNGRLLRQRLHNLNVWEAARGGKMNKKKKAMTTGVLGNSHASVPELKSAADESIYSLGFLL